MNIKAEVRGDLRAYVAGKPTAYTGTFEAIHQIMFGPLKFDAHVRAFRAFQFYRDQKRKLAEADAAVRAYLATQGVTV